MAYSLKTINEALRSDPAGFVAACEAAHKQKIRDAADRIAANRKNSHVILLSGPSGSGKTTTALMIEALLDAGGIETHTISMDNYFNTVDPETAPRNRDGDIDYESPFCLDIKKRIVRNRNFHSPPNSPIISSAWISAHSCHGYSFFLRISFAYSMHAKPSDVSGVSFRSGCIWKDRLEKQNIPST